MTKLEEFVIRTVNGPTTSLGNIVDHRSYCEFWLRAFVKLVRERAIGRAGISSYYTSPNLDRSLDLSEAFNEIVKEFELEEVMPKEK